MAKKTPFEVTAVQPENKLKKKLGDVDIKKAFPKNVLEAAESLISKSKDDYFVDAGKILAQMDEHYQTLPNADDKTADAAIKAIDRHSRSLRGQAETLGFDLMTHVTQSLCDFCSLFSKSKKEDQLVVLRKHLDILQIIIKEKMRDDGGKVGQELVQSLQLLTQKYR